MAQIIQFPRRRRRAQRVRVQQPVALMHEDGTAATGTAINLSCGGMQLLCDRYTTDSLYRSDVPLETASAPGIDVHLRLPLDAGLARLDIECRLIYVSTIDTRTYLLGLEFVRFHSDSQSCLAQFLRDAEVYANAE